MPPAQSFDEPEGLSGHGWAVFGLASVTVVTGLGVLAHLYLGSLSRFMADSYCHAAVTLRLGSIGMVISEYNRWSGRFSADWVDGALGAYVGPWIAPWWSPLLLILWLVALGLIAFQFSRGVYARYRLWMTVLVPLLVLFVTLDNTPIIGQTVYWTTGLNNYGIPLILFTFFLAFLKWREQRPLRGWTAAGLLLFSFVLNLIIGGFSETIVIVQCATLALGAAYFGLLGSREQKRQILPLLLAALLGAALALLIVAAAPGNKVRQSFSPPPPDLLTLGLYVLTFTKQVVLSTLAKEPLNIIGLPAVAALVGANLARKDGWLLNSPQAVLRTVLWVPVVTLALMAVAVTPAAYATSTIPNERNMLVVMYVLTIGLTVWGYAVGQLYRQLRADALQTPSERRGLLLAMAVVVAVFAANTLRTAQVTVNNREIYVNYARGWDQNHATILAARQSGATSAVITLLANPFGLEEPQADPGHWVSACYSDYYGITVTTPPAAQ